MESDRLHRMEYLILVLLFVSAVSPLRVRYTGAVNAGAPSSLQQELDRRCMQLYNEICQSGRSDFCAQKLTPVARKGVGKADQQELIFRCYDKDSVSGEQVDTSALGVYCVDDCGNLIRCKGTVNRAVGSFHASRHEEISKWIDAAKTTYCSELQKNFDKACSSQVTGSLSRIVGSRLDSRVACVPVERLVFESAGDCYNGCGVLSACPGKPEGGLTYRELSSTDVTNLLNGFHKPCKPDQTCTQVPGERVRCTTGSEHREDIKDNLQRWLDEKCKAEVEKMCRNVHTKEEICQKDAHVVMRKGYGHSNQRASEYRCYFAPKIENTHLFNLGSHGVSCVDNCGKDVLCGGTVNVQSKMHTTTPAVASWISEGKRLFCSTYQNAVQSVCDGVFPGSLARYGVEGGNAPGKDSWSCLKSPLVVYEGLAKCLNNCDRMSDCTGGILEDVSTDWSLQKQLSPEQVDTALRNLESPCGSTETCVASSRNPPQCKPVEHEAGTSGGNSATSVHLEDGDTAETTFSSLKAVVRIGECYRANIDLMSQQVEVGSSDHPTVISTVPATPPSKLSVHRSGDKVTLTLHYNLDSGSGSSLFYAQPDASCIGSEPVVFEGLEPEARVSRSGTKSVQS